MPGTKIDIFSLIIFLGFVQGMFLTILLLSKPDHSHKLLGLVLLVISVQIFDFFSAYSHISLRYPHMIDISVPLGLITGPLIWSFYSRFSTGRHPRLILLHLIVPAVFTFNLLFYYTSSADFKYNSFVIARGLNLPLKNISDGIISDPLGLRMLGDELIAFSLCIYSVLAMRELIKLMNLNNKNFWKVDDSSLKWLRNFGMLFCASAAFVLFNLIFKRNPASEYLIATGLTIIIYYTSYHFIQNSFILKKSFSVSKYEKSALTDALKEVIRKRLTDHMENEKPYLSNMFSLKKLSINISSSPNHVSQVINEVFNMSYFEYVASYRISEAMKYLSDPENNTRNIDEISFMVGYNSKAAFNKSFKKITGKTPLHFKKTT